MIPAELIWIVILGGIANSLLGIFLVLRGTSLISFGLAHSILFGIVVAFLITSSLTSPLLLVGAALTGVLIVSLVEIITNSKYIQYDAALGLIYLTVFALGIILLSRYASNTLLSVNSVVAGQLLLTLFNRVTILGINLPSVLWVLIVLVTINSLFLLLFWKELVLSSFDPIYADLLGKSSSLVGWLLMALTSLTIVGSYTAVGAILVVAFMITPPATAVLFSKDLRVILVVTLVISVTGSLGGLFLAYQLDLPPTGTIAVVYSVMFILSLVLGPQSDLRAKLLSRLLSQEDRLQPPPSYIRDHGGL